MNQIFKDRYQQFLSADIVKNSESLSSDQSYNDAGDITFYEDHSGIRNICFIFLDGRKTFLNYNYLVPADFKPDQSKMIMRFTTHHVTLDGINLELLFDDIMIHSIRSIHVRDKRYNQIEQQTNIFVNAIEIIEL